MTLTEHTHTPDRVTIEITAYSEYAVNRTIAKLKEQYADATFIEPVQVNDGMWVAIGHRT